MYEFSTFPWHKLHISHSVCFHVSFVCGKSFHWTRFVFTQITFEQLSSKFCLCTYKMVCVLYWSSCRRDHTITQVLAYCLPPCLFRLWYLKWSFCLNILATNIARVLSCRLWYANFQPFLWTSFVFTIEQLLRDCFVCVL